MNNHEQTLESISETDTFELIRVDTALARYPIHRLSNKGTININIRKTDEKGTAVLLWMVDYSNNQGQPGPLAYKLDTRIINRTIDEQGRPTPKLLRLGSLHEIAQELGLGRNTLAVRKALMQNVGAIINAKIVYKALDKTERKLEAAFNRYSVIFTGEELPDGRKANSVFLLLNDIYLEVLNSATRRPLDYDYLSELAPGPQRFYEILSYEMLPAVRYNQRAKLPYSEYCMYSTMTRYSTFDQVKKQMNKIHQPHIKAGYIARKVEYQATVDEDGKPDWNMFYTPGEKAKFQQLVFSFAIPAVRRKQHKPSPLVQDAKPANRDPEQNTPVLPLKELQSDKEKPYELVKSFYTMRYNQAQEPTEREIAEAGEYIAESEEWANFLIRFGVKYGVENNGFPNDFGGLKKLISQARIPFSANKKEAEAQGLKNARKTHQEIHTPAYHTFLGQLLSGKLEISLPDVFLTFTSQEKTTFQFHHSRAEKSAMSRQVVEGFFNESERVRRLLKFIDDNPKSGIPTFWQWDEKINPQKFT